MTPKLKVLVVDDEKGVRNLLEAMLEKSGYEAVCAEDAEKALEEISRTAFKIIITDLKLPGLSGEELLERVKKIRPQTSVIVISAYGNTKNVVDVIKRGAEDYLPKPFTQEDLEVVLHRAMEKQKLLMENVRLRKEISNQSSGPMIGRSKAIEKVHQLIQKFAPSDSPVLITGESGVGKELAARAIHEQSPNAAGPLIQVNAGSLPASLFEAELFGVKKGAFTGANESRVGLFEAADGGTLFLDEIAEVPMESQAKLLRALESGEVRPVGETRSRKIKVRVIVATNQDLEDMVAQKTFRKDLFYRLSVLTLHLPPLRERLEDIQALSNYFLEKQSSKGKGSKKLSNDSLKWLVGHDWPGNIRELKNVLERAALISSGPEITPQDLILTEGEEIAVDLADYRQAKRSQLKVFEKTYLVKMLKECDGNVTQAAARAGLARRNFQTLIKKNKIQPAQYKKNKN